MSKNICEKCFPSKLLDTKESWDGAQLTNVSRFLRVTSSPNFIARPMGWLKTNAARFPAVAIVAKDVLGI